MSIRSSATRLVGAGALGIVLAACTAPDPIPGPDPGGGGATGLTISGTVLEFTESGLRGPVPNLRLKVRFGSATDPIGDLPDVITDANGRYSIPIPAGSWDMVYLRTAAALEYRSLCNAWPIIARGGLAGGPAPNLPVVRNSWAGTQLPPGIGGIPGSPIYGTVMERVDGRSEPIADATISGIGIENPPATTSASGFYMSCRMGADWSSVITAQKAGYSPAARQVELGFEGRVDFELTRAGSAVTRSR